MKRIKLILGISLMVVLFSFSRAIAQETPAMKAANERFRKQQAQRPASETSYKNTKEWKAASPDQRQKAEDQMKRNNDALNKLRQQQSKGTARKAY